MTIPDLSKELNLSVPKVTNIINDLIEDGLVRDNGKITSNGGRRPSIYGLEPESGFFLGIDVKKNYLNLGLWTSEQHYKDHRKPSLRTQ